MNYSDELDEVIKNALTSLIKDYQSNKIMFNEQVNKEYCRQYLQLKEDEKN